MKRSDFLKKAIGLIGIAYNPTTLATLIEPVSEITETIPYVPGETLGAINKSYVSALDPILDTREINRMIGDYVYDDNLNDLLDAPTHYSWESKRKDAKTYVSIMSTKHNRI